MVTIEKVVLDQRTDDKNRRHPRWTRQETLLLLQAKEITENSPHKGRKMNSVALVGSASDTSNTEPKWVSISSYCKQQGVDRGPAQCRKRWSNLIGDFKKVKNWESKLTDKADSFWSMRNDVRKEKKLPVSFDVEVFKVFDARDMTSASYAAASPMPLQAVTASGVSETVTDYVDSDEEGIGDEEEEQEAEDPLLSDILGDVQKDNKTSDTATEIPVKDSSNAEPSSEQQHDQAFQNQKRCLSQGTFRESWPGISYWESQERRKRQRPSVNSHRANDMETQIAKVLEKNSEMFNAQLDALNKNFQSDREQRKETNDMLVAALRRLSDSLVKITEKL